MILCAMKIELFKHLRFIHLSDIIAHCFDNVFTLNQNKGLKCLKLVM